MNRWISSLLTTLYDYWMIGERLCSITCSIGTDALQKISYAIKLVAAQLLSEKSGSYINQSTKYAGVSFSPFITQIGGVSTSTHQLDSNRQGCEIFPDKVLDDDSYHKKLRETCRISFHYISSKSY